MSIFLSFNNRSFMTIEWQGGGSNKTFQGSGIDEFRVQQKGQENKDVNNFENRDEICPKAMTISTLACVLRSTRL